MDILLDDGRRKYPKSKLLASSAGRSWSNISAELRSHPAGRIESVVQTNVGIIIAINGADDACVRRTAAQRHEQALASTGTIWLAPIGIGDEEIEITAPLPKALHLYVAPHQFNLLADQFNLTRSAVHSIQYLGGLRDELIREIGLSVLSELNEESTTSTMLVETASAMLAARLSHSYADRRLHEHITGQVHRLDNARLRRVLDHIDQHLEDDITVSNLADLANLSVFHFTRMFASAVGAPPHRYVSRRRLEQAMAMLAAGKLPLSEIAHRTRFSSQASFSRAFLRATGMSPGEYRRLVGS